MSADAIRLLAELNRAGIALWAEEGQLRFRSRKGQLTAQLKAALATHREALLALLGAAATAEVAIGKRSGAASAPVPLSAQQHAVWMAEQNGGGKAFLIPGALSLVGSLDIGALRAAFQGLLDRHEAFRTAIRVENERPLQVVLPALLFEMPQIDLSGLSEIEQSARVSALLAAEAEQPFQLDVAPLLRVKLIMLGSERHVLTLTPHHIVADGWSIDIMVRELSRLYRPGAGQHGSGPELQLGAAPLGYADFAAWQDNRSRQGGDGADLEYWRSTLARLPTPLELPSERPAGAVAEFAGASLRAELPAAASSGLRRLATQAGTTLFSALASAFAALLYRYTGQTDLILGTAVAGRGRAELEDVIGLFAGRLPLRLDLDGDPSFQELLKRVAATAAAAFSHAEVPAERILSEAVAPDARSGLFQVMIALQNAVSSQLAFSGLEVQPLPITGDTAKFDLFLAIDETVDTLAFSLEYSTARFGQERMQRLLTHLVRLTAAAAATPQLPLSRLPMLAPQERQALLNWSGNAAHWPGPDNLWQRFSQMAAALPEQTALIAPPQWGELQAQTVSYGALHARALAIGGRLLQAGMQQGEVVALEGERSIGFIEGMLGILAAGGSYMPIAPDLPAARIAELLEETAASLLVSVSRNGLPMAQQFRATICTGDSDPGTATAVMPAVAGNARAYIMFTSGSTGRPKGVEVTHANVVHFVAGMPTTPGDRSAVFLHFAPTGFDASVLEIWSALLTGARIVVAPPGLPSLDALADLIETQQVSVSFLTAGLFQQMCEVRAAALSRLDCLMAGGDRVSLAAVRAVMACGGRVRLYNGYGPTETTVIACHHEVRPLDLDAGAHSLPIGSPHGNSRLYVLDGHGEPVAAGVIGELYIGGGGVAAGYINRPELSAERFLPDPFSAEPQARMYRSGDLVRRRSDGMLDFLGRADRQLKIRGFRIEPGEIEACLSQHPAVAHAAVELKSVGGHARLVAYIVAALPEAGGAEAGVGAPLDLASMREFLSLRLPEHMIPGALVTLDSLPLTRNGKLDRAALPLPVLEAAGESPATRPASPESLLLAGIWQDVLQVAQVGMEDNFYDLGGDSIMAMQVAMRLTRQGWELRPQEMLRHPTLQAQSKLMRRRLQTLAKRSDHGPLPVTPIQNWFFDLDLAKRHHWNQALRLALAPPALSSLEQALMQLEQAHEALRLRFLKTGDGWLQQAVAASGRLLQRVAADSAEQALAHIEAAQCSLDIENGPVWRALLIEGAHAEWPHLVLVAHHLVIDGVSWRIVLEDLTLALQGKAIEAPTLGMTDWAAHLATATPAPRPSAGRLPTLPPFDRPYGSNLEADTSIVTLELPPEVAADLLGTANIPYRSEPTELLLAGVMLGLRSAFNRTELSVALERHGREAGNADLSGTVGWFTSIEAVHLSLEASAGAGQALLALKQTIRSAAREMPATQGEMPTVAFNYLGRFDNSLPPGGPFRLVEEGSGAASAADNCRPYALEIVASVDAAGLRIDFRFSRAQFERDTIDAWAAAAKLALLDIVAHAKTSAAGGRAPCDFPLAGIGTQQELDALLAENRLNASQIADLLPVSSQQRGMLLENMAHRERGLHIEQFVATFEGPLDQDALESSWHAVLSRHETLRSSFIWRPAGDPLCVVFERSEAAWQHLDWSGLDDASQQLETAAWLQQDGRAGFDGSGVPLRFATMRLSPARWLFVWTYHHALLDGWSVAQLLAEVLEGDGGSTLPTSVRDHARWLASRDRNAAAAFWQANLAHAQTPTMPGRYDEQLASGSGHADLRKHVTAGVVRQLEQLARRHRTTPALVAQGAWALTMAWASGRSDVVFSITVSGRPAEVAGSEAWVGLFINSLPLCLAIPAAGNAWQWLAGLGAVTAALTPYEWCAGGDIHSWSGLPLNRALSDTLLIFENFPRAQHQPIVDGPARAQLVSVAGHGSRTHFPVTLVIVPDNGWRCEMAGDNAYFPESESAKLLDAFILLLEQLAEDNVDIATALAALPLPPGVCVPPARIPQAPRTPLELDLAKLWEDLFSYSPIGIDDNFFSLGGHSLLALDLMSRLRSRFGRNVPFTAFLSDPTVSGLSGLLEGDEEKGGVSLLPLGVAGQPLYLMPGASGNPLAYLPLAQMLEGRIAVIGAQPDMLLETAAISIEAIAAELARSIALHQPHGTVHLAGHSFGAVVAFETARQMAHAGRQIGALILIDTTVPDGGKEFIGYGESDWIVAISEAAASYFGRAVEIRMEQLAPLSPLQQRTLLLQRFKAAGTLPAGASIDVIDDLLLTYRRSIEALSTYAPKYWDGALSIIRSSETPAPADPALGWGVLCREIAATFQAPGDHITMVTEIHAVALAELIQQCITESSNASTTSISQ